MYSHTNSPADTLLFALPMADYLLIRAASERLHRNRLLPRTLMEDMARLREAVSYHARRETGADSAQIDEHRRLFSSLPALFHGLHNCLQVAGDASYINILERHSYMHAAATLKECMQRTVEDAAFMQEWMKFVKQVGEFHSDKVVSLQAYKEWRESIPA